MSIDRYIRWGDIWSSEVDPKASAEALRADGNDAVAEVVEQFIRDEHVELLPDECELRAGGELLFAFGETGGQSEGDSQGWSRDYTFIVGRDFAITDAEYEQG